MDGTANTPFSLGNLDQILINLGTALGCSSDTKFTVADNRSGKTAVYQGLNTLRSDFAQHSAAETADFHQPKQVNSTYVDRVAVSLMAIVTEILALEDSDNVTELTKQIVQDKLHTIPDYSIDSTQQEKFKKLKLILNEDKDSEEFFSEDDKKKPFHQKLIIFSRELQPEPSEQLMTVSNALLATLQTLTTTGQVLYFLDNIRASFNFNGVYAKGWEQFLETANYLVAVAESGSEKRNEVFVEMQQQIQAFKKRRNKSAQQEVAANDRYSEKLKKMTGTFLVASLTSSNDKDVRKAILAEIKPLLDKGSSWYSKVLSKLGLPSLLLQHELKRQNFQTISYNTRSEENNETIAKVIKARKKSRKQFNTENNLSTLSLAEQNKIISESNELLLHLAGHQNLTHFNSATHSTEMKGISTGFSRKINLSNEKNFKKAKETFAAFKNNQSRPFFLSIKMALKSTPIIGNLFFPDIDANTYEIILFLNRMGGDDLVNRINREFLENGVTDYKEALNNLQKEFIRTLSLTDVANLETLDFDRAKKDKTFVEPFKQQLCRFGRNFDLDYVPKDTSKTRQLRKFSDELYQRLIDECLLTKHEQDSFAYRLAEIPNPASNAHEVKLNAVKEELLAAYKARSRYYFNPESYDTSTNKDAKALLAVCSQLAKAIKAKGNESVHARALLSTPPAKAYEPELRILYKGLLTEAKSKGVNNLDFDASQYDRAQLLYAICQELSSLAPELEHKESGVKFADKLSTLPKMTNKTRVTALESFRKGLIKALKANGTKLNENAFRLSSSARARRMHSSCNDMLALINNDNIKQHLETLGIATQAEIEEVANSLAETKSPSNNNNLGDFFKAQRQLSGWLEKYSARYFDPGAYELDQTKQTKVMYSLCQQLLKLAKLRLEQNGGELQKTWSKKKTLSDYNTLRQRFKNIAKISGSAHEDELKALHQALMDFHSPSTSKGGSYPYLDKDGKKREFKAERYAIPVSAYEATYEAVRSEPYPYWKRLYKQLKTAASYLSKITAVILAAGQAMLGFYAIISVLGWNPALAFAVAMCTSYTNFILFKGDLFDTLKALFIKRKFFSGESWAPIDLFNGATSVPGKIIMATAFALVVGMAAVMGILTFVAIMGVPAIPLFAAWPIALGISLTTFIGFTGLMYVALAATLGDIRSILAPVFSAANEKQAEIVSSMKNRLIPHFGMRVTSFFANVIALTSYPIYCVPHGFYTAAKNKFSSVKKFWKNPLNREKNEKADPILSTPILSKQAQTEINSSLASIKGDLELIILHGSIQNAQLLAIYGKFNKNLTNWARIQAEQTNNPAYIAQLNRRMKHLAKRHLQAINELKEENGKPIVLSIVEQDLKQKIGAFIENYAGKKQAQGVEITELLNQINKLKLGKTPQLKSVYEEFNRNLTGWAGKTKKHADDIVYIGRLNRNIKRLAKKNLQTIIQAKDQNGNPIVLTKTEEQLKQKIKLFIYGGKKQAQREESRHQLTLREKKKRMQYVVRTALLPAAYVASLALLVIGTVTTLFGWNTEVTTFLTDWAHLPSNVANIISGVLVFGITGIVDTVFNFRALAGLFKRLVGITSDSVIAPACTFVYRLLSEPRKLSNDISSGIKSSASKTGFFFKNLLKNPWKTLYPLFGRLKNLFLDVPTVIGNAAGFAPFAAGGSGILTKAGFPNNIAKNSAFLSAFFTSVGCNSGAMLSLINEQPPVDIATLHDTAADSLAADAKSKASTASVDGEEEQQPTVSANDEACPYPNKGATQVGFFGTPDAGKLEQQLSHEEKALEAQIVTEKMFGEAMHKTAQTKICSQKLSDFTEMRPQVYLAAKAA